MARVLIVEDEPHIARVTALWLTRHGHEVIETGDGMAALDVLSRETVDIIVSDMNMPGLDGAGLAKAVRQDCKLTVPILLLTARCDHGELIAQLAPLGVRLYPKPFVPSRLVAEVDELTAAAHPL